MRVGGQFLFIVSQFLRNRGSACVWMERSVFVDVVSGVLQVSVLGLFIVHLRALIVGTIWWAMRIIQRSMQSFLGRFRIFK